MPKIPPPNSANPNINRCSVDTQSSRRNLKANDRRAVIIEAATELFTQHGFEHTSLDMVIALSGGSKRAIYEHFDDKQGLLHAVAVELIDRVLQPIFTAQIDQQDERVALQAIGNSFLKAMISKQGIAIIKELIAQTNNTPDLGVKIWQIGPAKVQQQLAHYLEHLNQTGRFVIADTHLASRQFLSLVKSDFHLQHLMGAVNTLDDATINQHVEQSVEVFLKIIH